MKKDTLENAMADLHLLTQREFSTAESKTIKWREIDSRIETMKLALEADDGVSFEKNRSELLKNVRAC